MRMSLTGAGFGEVDTEDTGLARELGEREGEETGMLRRGPAGPGRPGWGME